MSRRYRVAIVGTGIGERHVEGFLANPEKFELLDQRTVSDSETWAHLAVAGEELFVRELNGLSAWRWKLAP